MNKIVLAPLYYNEFSCIADQCRHSCCIDWEICIDDETMAKYRPIDSIARTVTHDDNGACFTLGEDGRCPHLDERGLCRIILSHGEDYLCDICKNHPRFYNDVGNGRIEAGLGPVCEEACRLILTDERPFALAAITESTAQSIPNADSNTPRAFDPLPARDNIVALIENTSGNLDEILDALRAAFAIGDVLAPAAWIDRFLTLEILDSEWPTVLQAAKQSPGATATTLRAYDPYFTRLLIYFVYRHVSVTASPRHLRARLAFAMLSTSMIRFLFAAAETPSFDVLCDRTRRYSAEIEYSEDNTDELIFALECRI